MASTIFLLKLLFFLFSSKSTKIWLCSNLVFPESLKRSAQKGLYL